MVTLTLLDHVEHCVTHEDGQVIFDMLLPLLAQGDTVSVSFKGVGGVPSSFVNTAFVPVLKHFSFDFIKTHVFFVDTVKATNDVIRKRFRFEVDRMQQKAA